MLPVLLLAVLSADPTAPSAAAALVERSESARRAGRLDEALQILDAGERALPRTTTRAERIRVSLQKARCTYYRSSLAGAPHDAVIGDLKRIVAEAEAAADPILIADAKDQLGLALYGRDFRATAQDEARALFEEALAARRAKGDERRVAESLFHVALTWENKKDPSPEDKSRSRALHEESLATAEAGGFEVEASYAVRHLAGHKQDAGDLDGALKGFERSLALREKAGYVIYLAPSLLAVGDVWKEKGDTARARWFFERARLQADRIGSKRFREMADEALAALDAKAGTP